jgi:hypothetical protein
VLSKSESWVSNLEFGLACERRASLNGEFHG